MKKSIILIQFIILKFVLQFNLVTPEYSLHRDEFLHVDQGRHLAWGYLSVPPFTSWTSYLILQLGGGEFWVKFFPAMFGALTIYLVWEIIRILNGSLYALVLGATAITLSSLLRINLLYQPNSADIFFWTLLYYLLIRYFLSENVKWLWYGAVAFALGVLNKYNILLLAAGLVPALLMTPERRIFRKKSLYFAAFISLLLILPNLIWQYMNGFPVIWHMRELAETQLVNVDRFNFFKDQLLFFLGAIHILAAGFAVLIIYKPLRKFRFILWSFVFTMALFVFFKAKAYYAIGLYPVIIAFGSVYLGHLLYKGRLRYLRPVAIVIPILMLIPLITLAFPIYSPQKIAENGERYKELGLLRWEDGKDHTLPQDFADMLGWKELAGLVDSAYATIPDARENTLILCDNYGQAGAINFYTSKGLRAVSMNADYINWFPDIPYENIILVQEADDTDPDRKRERPLFERISFVGKITNGFAREAGTSVYVLRGAKVDIRPLIDEEKSQNGHGY